MSPDATFVLPVVTIRCSKGLRAGPSPRRVETVSPSTPHVINTARAAFLI